MKVALIGAGPCGLTLMHAMRNKEKAGEDIPELVCFEKQPEVGGLWNYTWRTGLDQHGEPLHQSQYRYLWSNAPKECLEFSDYSFFEHYGKAIPSFPPRMVLRDYIMGRVKKNGVLDGSSKKMKILYNTVVRDVTFENGKFTLKSFDSIKKVTSTADFDYLVVATGHFSYPNMPIFPGLDTFNGRILHAHDFRDAVSYKGENVLLIGSSYSAEDIGLQLVKYGANRVTISYRSNPMGFKWPDNIEELPLLTSINDDTVTFPDKVTRKIDTIIMCTGYQMKHNYLPDSLRLQSPNIWYPDGLYKGVVWNKNPKCLYLGMQNQCYTFTMFDVQAWYARDVILQKIAVPSLEERNKDIKHWCDREDNLKDVYDAIAFQRDYVKDLHKYSDYPHQDHDQVGKYFDQWVRDKLDDIMTYREKCFKSVVSGHMAPLHHTKWILALDDSIETFMNVNKN